MFSGLLFCIFVADFFSKKELQSIVQNAYPSVYAFSRKPFFGPKIQIYYILLHFLLNYIAHRHKEIKQQGEKSRIKLIGTLR